MIEPIQIQSITKLYGITGDAASRGLTVRRCTEGAPEQRLRMTYHAPSRWFFSRTYFISTAVLTFTQQWPFALHWPKSSKVLMFRCPKMGLWSPDSKNGDHFFTPTSPKNGGIDICFMCLQILDENFEKLHFFICGYLPWYQGTFSFLAVMLEKRPKKSQKLAKSQNWLKTHSKVINAQNKRLFYHFWGMLGL